MVDARTPDAAPLPTFEAGLVKRFIASGLSAALAETVTYPLDVTKTQMQVRQHRCRPLMQTGSVQMGWKEVHTLRRLEARGFIRTGRSIFAKSGVRGFYKGLPAATTRAVFSNGLSLSIYKPLLSMVSGRSVQSNEPFESPLGAKVLAAFMTGVLTQTIANPVDVIKVTMQAEGLREAPRFNGTAGAVRYISRTGLSSFWTGLSPSIARSGLAVASTIATYHHTKDLLMRRHGATESFQVHCMASAASGLMASACSSPADLIKTRIMTQSMRRPLYTSVVDCLSTVVVTEGPIALFKGFMPIYLRLAPWQLVFFLTYEAISVLVGASNI